MEDQTFWEIVAANVVSIRLHPRNDGNGEVADQVILAAKVADLMCEARSVRWPQDGQQPPRLRPMR